MVVSQSTCTMLQTLYILYFLFSLIILFIIYRKKVNYLLLSPLFSFNLCWLLIFLFYALGDDFLRNKTAYIILLFTVTFNASYVLFDAGVLIKKRKLSYARFHEPKFKIQLFFLVFQLISVVVSMTYAFYAMDKSLSAVLLGYTLNAAQLRQKLAVMEYEVPYWLRVLNLTGYSNYFSVILAVVYSHRNSSFLNVFFLFASIILSAAYSLTTMNRSGFFLVLTLVAYAYFTINRISIISTIKMFFVFLTVFFVFSFVVTSVREGDNRTKDGLISQIHSYIVSGLAGLDSFISGNDGETFTIEEKQQNYITATGFDTNDIELGKNTFKGVFYYFSKITGSETYYPAHGEYIVTPMLTNIYTIIRPLYQDYGWLGILFLPIVFAYAIVCIYKNSLANKNIFSLFIIAYMNYVNLRLYGGLELDVKLIFAILFMSSVYYKLCSKYNYGAKSIPI